MPNWRVIPADLRSRTNSQQSFASQADKIPELPGVTTSHIRQAFDEFDLDKSGWIGVSELRYVLTICGENPTDAELDEMLRMVCSDGGGQVSFDDYCKLFDERTPMLAEMAAIREQAVADAAPPPMEEESALDEGEFETLVKGAASFMAAFDNAKVKRERAARLPKAKARPVRRRGGSTGSKEAVQLRGPSKEASKMEKRQDPNLGKGGQASPERQRLRRGQAASVLEPNPSFGPKTTRDSQDWRER